MEDYRQEDVEHLAVGRGQLADMLGLPLGTIKNMRKKGLLPTPLVFIECERWLISEIKEWLLAGCPDGAAWAEMKNPPTPDSGKLAMLAMPVGVLNFGVRVSGCLFRAGIKTVGDLVELYTPDLLAIRHFGWTSLRDVDMALSGLGLSRPDPQFPATGDKL